MARLPHSVNTVEPRCNGVDSSVHSVTLPRTVLPVPPHSPDSNRPARARTPHGLPLPRTSGGPCTPRSIALCSLLTLLPSSPSLADYLVTLFVIFSSRPRSCTRFRSLPSDLHLTSPLPRRFLRSVLASYSRERARWTRSSPPPPPHRSHNSSFRTGPLHTPSPPPRLPQ